MHFGLETTTLPLRVSIAVLPIPTGLLGERGENPPGGSVHLREYSLQIVAAARADRAV